MEAGGTRVHLDSQQLATFPKHLAAEDARTGPIRWLSVARNKLSSLEGVEALGSLVSLNASFNRISSLDEVSRLVKLRSLSELDLRLNPITRTSGYRQRVLALLPTLSVLDGRATGVPQVARSVAPLSPTSSPTPDPQLEYSRDSTEAFQSPLSPISRSAEDVGGGPGGDRDHTGGDGARRWPESRVPSNDRAAVARDMDVAERLSYISVSGDEDSAGAVGMLGGGEPKGLRSGEDRVGRRRRRRVDDGRDTGVMMNMNKDRNGDGDGDGNGDEHEPHHHAGAGSTIRDLSRLTGLRGEALSTMASRLLQDPDLQRLATARTATVAEAGSVDGVLHRLRREADTAQLPPGFHRTLTLSLDQVKDLLAKERQDHASECARLRSDRADCRHLASIARTRTQEAERALANTQRQLMDLQRHERAPDASAAAAAAPAPVCAPPSEDMKAMVTMLHEAHGALVSTNKRLLQQLRSEQEARAAETAQLRKNFAELRRRYETVTSHYTGSSAPGAPG